MIWNCKDSKLIKNAIKSAPKVEKITIKDLVGFDFFSAGNARSKIVIVEILSLAETSYSVSDLFNILSSSSIAELPGFNFSY